VEFDELVAELNGVQTGRGAGAGSVEGCAPCSAISLLDIIAESWYVQPSFTDLFQESDALIQKFERIYRLELLELAVWKVECLRQMPIGTDLYTSHGWIVSGWKRVKTEQR
jgi:hypothetical protein